MNSFLRFNSAEAAISGLLEHEIVTGQIVGIVTRLRDAEQCDIDAVVMGCKEELSARVPYGMQGKIQTGQFVLVEADHPRGYVATDWLSPSFHVQTRRFFTRRNLEAHEKMARKREKGSLWFRITRPLDSPLQRVGLVTLICGLVASLIGIFQIVGSIGSYNFFTRLFTAWWGSVVQDRYNYQKYPFAAWGAYLFIAGYLLSYGYQQTIGRLIRWIATGSTPRS